MKPIRGDEEAPGLRDAPTILTFAYGSNLDLEHVLNWGREHGHEEGVVVEAVGHGWLRDRALDWCRKRQDGSGALDAVPLRGAAADGWLVHVNDAGLALLDAKEGVPWAYERTTMAVQTGPTLTSAEVYEAAERSAARFPPKPEYFDRVARARERLGLRPVAPPTEVVEGMAGTEMVGQLFVYGTFRAGELRAPRLDALSSGNRRAGATCAALYDLGPYPGLVLCPPAGETARHPNRVHGELVNLADPPQGLAVLDTIEGYRPTDEAGSLYSRRLITVEAADGVHLAWTYAWNGEVPERRIDSGDWQRR